MLKRFVPAAAVLAIATTSLATPAQADTVADWYEAIGIVGGIGPPTPEREKARSQTALAMFEAANAIDRRYESYLGFPAANGAASADAAVAVAAHDVLSAAYPDQAATLKSSLDYDLGQIADGPEKEAGVAVGHAAAKAAMARPITSADPVRDYLPAATPGLYVPTDLPVLSMGAYQAKCWFLAKPDEFAPKPPPALKSEAWAKDYDEVRGLGRKTGSERTPAQTAAANFWLNNSPELAMRLLSNAPDRSLVQNARLYAKVSMAMSDSITAISVAKFDNQFWRPITAIRNGAADGNAATQPDSGWEPLFRTPLHPEYPCGHCILAATVATILAAEFGKDARLTFTDPTMPGAGQTLTPAQYVEAVSMSRIYAGVHYRFSNEAAEEMGREIGEKAVSGFMRPVAR